MLNERVIVYPRRIVIVRFDDELGPAIRETYLTSRGVFEEDFRDVTREEAYALFREYQRTQRPARRMVLGATCLVAWNYFRAAQRMRYAASRVRRLWGRVVRRSATEHRVSPVFGGGSIDNSDIEDLDDVEDKMARELEMLVRRMKGVKLQ